MCGQETETAFRSHRDAQTRPAQQQSFLVQERSCLDSALSGCLLTFSLLTGGHTGEMVRLLSALDFERYTPRVYFVTAGDVMSLTKLGMLEQSKASGRVSIPLIWIYDLRC